MQCSRCRTVKLSGEFPAMVSLECDHAPGACLSCCVEVGQCPECRKLPSSSELRTLLEQLQGLECSASREVREHKERARKVAEEERWQQELRGTDVHGSITIAVLDGRTFQVRVSSSTTMLELRQSIRLKSGVEPASQVLLHSGRRLGSGDTAGARSWSDLKVPFGAVVQLVVLMHSVNAPGGTTVIGDMLTFSISWSPTVIGGRTTKGYPKIAQLQGVCTALDSTGAELDVVSFSSGRTPGIVHSGSSGYHNPTQEITVDLGSLPCYVQSLFFTLCSRQGLEVIIDPTVCLSDGCGQELATYSPEMLPDPHYSHVEGGAIVLCCAARTTTGWEVVQCGTRSGGYLHAQSRQVYSRLYEPIRNEIRRLSSTVLLAWS